MLPVDQVVHDGQSLRGRVKESCLPFEGFLEALCRMAPLKSLPTRAQVAEAGEADAGAFLLHLRAVNAERYKAFLRDPSTRVEWSAQMPTDEMEPVEGRLEHLLHLVFRSITGADAPMRERVQLTPGAVSAWVRDVAGGALRSG